MILIKKDMPRFVLYLLLKLAGAGFCLTLLYAFILQVSGFSLNIWLVEVKEWTYWQLIYGCGIASSVVIDLLTFKMKGLLRFLVKILLYVTAGFIIFNLKEINAITIMAGIAGSIFALIFYFGTYASRQSRLYKYVFAIAFPLLFLLLGIIA
ncbi:Uncharacterised protein [Chlamydia abortus]|nr:Uncharacterised protein [Chlamydia abortus]